MKLKKGDMVVVNTGSEKGKKGKILRKFLLTRTGYGDIIQTDKNISIVFIRYREPLQRAAV